jgi:hypothetical protein
MNHESFLRFGSLRKMGKICAIWHEEDEQSARLPSSEEKERKCRRNNEFGFADRGQLSWSIAFV